MFGLNRSVVVAATACAVVAGSAIWLAAPAHAEFVMTVLESGSDVVMTGSGTIDTTDLDYLGWTSGDPDLVAEQGIAMLGPAFDLVSIYTGAGGISAFGTGGRVGADSGSGSSAGIYPGIVYVPVGYVSGAALSGSAIFSNETFASLGATPGIYLDRWGSAAHADSFVLEIGPVSAPEPGGVLLLPLPLGAMGFFARGRRSALNRV
jgi:hypothetical protein